MFDASQLRATLVGPKFRREHIGVTAGSAEINLIDDRATINIQALAAAGSWMPETGQVLDIESTWATRER